MLIYGATGNNDSVNLTLHHSSDIIRSERGIIAGSMIGKQWQKSRFLTPYLRNTLWDQGYAVDTLETAVTWDKAKILSTQLKETILDQAGKIETPIIVMVHLSHMYRDGVSIYVTYILPRASSCDELLNKWQSIKTAASQAILTHGGTISHQHGIGQDHLPFLSVEKGEIGIEILRNISKTCDPSGILNSKALIKPEKQPEIN